jgi:hypothetical protein
VAVLFISSLFHGIDLSPNEKRERISFREERIMDQKSKILQGFASH